MINRRVSIRNYRDGDYESLTLKKGVFSDSGEIGQKLSVLLSHPSSHVMTIQRCDTPIAVVGLVVEWEGVGKLWSVSSEEVRETPLGFHRAVKALMESYQDALSLRRLHMTVAADYHEGCRWAELLGFECEGRLKQYDSSGKDHLMYARIYG